MVWYSQLFWNFQQFIVIHTIKGFVIVNKAEIDVFLELFCFFNDPVNVDNLISGSSLFSAIKVLSSAYLRLLIFFLEILIPGSDSSSPAFCMMYCACKLNKQGDNIQP